MYYIESPFEPFIFSALIYMINTEVLKQESELSPVSGMLIPKMFRNPKNSVLLNRKTKRNHEFYFENFLYLSVVQGYQKFSNPDQECSIPKNPIPGLFGNAEVLKMFHTRTSGFPKQKKNRNGPTLYKPSN